MENCSDCYYSRPSTFPDKDGKKWYSCRYNPPMPYANEKQTQFKDWRIVPEDFWCGQYATHYDATINTLEGQLR